jgi:hypothetical protein
MEQPSFRQLVITASDIYDRVVFNTNDLYNEPAPDPIVSRNPFGSQK